MISSRYWQVKCVPFGVRKALLVLLVPVFVALLLVPVSPALAAPPVLLAGGGSGPGQVQFPFGVSIDQSTGTVYIADAGNARVDAFGASGNFLFDFGSEFPEPNSVSFDPASHDIFVSNAELHNGVSRYGPAGEFLGKLTGVELQDHYHNGDALPNAVDSAGNVWVGNGGSVDEFSSSGVFESEVSLPGQIEIGSLAVDSAGDFYTIPAREGLGGLGVQKFTPSGEPIYTLEASGDPEALTLDGSGHLSVAGRVSEGGKGSPSACWSSMPPPARRSSRSLPANCSVSRTATLGLQRFRGNPLYR